MSNIVLPQLVQASSAVEAAQTATFHAALRATPTTSTPQATQGTLPQVQRCKDFDPNQGIPPHLPPREKVVPQSNGTISPRLTEPFVAWCVSRDIRMDAGIFLSSSMPCRDFDTFADSGGSGEGEGSRSTEHLSRVGISHVKKYRISSCYRKSKCRLQNVSSPCIQHCVFRL